MIISFYIVVRYSIKTYFFKISLYFFFALFFNVICYIFHKITRENTSGQFEYRQIDNLGQNKITKYNQAIFLTIYNIVCVTTNASIPTLCNSIHGIWTNRQTCVQRIKHLDKLDSFILSSTMF